ncbi:hypothetical protein ONZ45_g13144 [Pleurotus djamor]|nr:hypothetical protein ONZ45_g13144 [Pleurotus djamor]
MGQMNPAQLHYVEVMCESILHGVYAVLIVVVIWLLMNHRTMPLIHKVMFYAGIVMFVLSSCHLGLVIQQVTVPEVPIKNAQAQVSIATLQVRHSKWSKCSRSLTSQQLMIGDCILIWRVWAVWNKKWWPTILPILLMLAAAGVRFAVVGDLAGVVKFSSDPSTALVVANLGICTLLISGRIWYLQRKIGQSLEHSPSRRAYNGVLMLLIESGVLYFFALFISLVLDAVHSEGIHAVLDMQIPIVGILPTLIVLLVHLDMVPGGRVQEEYMSTIQSGFNAAPGKPVGSITVTSRSQTISFGPDVEMGESQEWKVANRSQGSV